jgi:hypothetical protein
VPAPDLPLHGAAGVGQAEPYAAAVGWVSLAGDEPAVSEPVHHAGQGGLAEQDVPVQLGQAYRLLALGQRVEHVVLAHGDIGPDVFGREPLDQRAVRGQQRLPRVVGRVPGVGHHNSGYSAWTSEALSW